MKLLLRKSLIIKILLIVFILIPQIFGSGATNLVFALLAFLMSVIIFPVTLNRNIFSPMLILVFVIITSCFSMMIYNDAVLTDILRDVLILFRPIFYLYVGFIFAKHIKDKEFIFKVLIYVGVGLAIHHIINIVLNYETVLYGNINQIRSEAGRSGMAEVFALMFLLSKNNFLKLRQSIRLVLVGVLLISLLSYFSRTMLLAEIIVFIGLRNGFRFSFKYVWFFLVGTLLIFISWSFINNMELDRSSTGFESVLYKIKNAPSEIFSTSFDLDNKAELWDRWRSYEAVMAFRTMQDSSGEPFIYGRGLGSTVDVGFYAPLTEDGIRYIPTLHNGFAHVLLKAGIVGVLMYLSFLLYVFKKGRVRITINDPFTYLLSSNMLLTLVVLIFFTSFAVAGMYNQTEIFTLLIGACLFLQTHYKKIKN